MTKKASKSKSIFRMILRWGDHGAHVTPPPPPLSKTKVNKLQVVLKLSYISFIKFNSLCWSPPSIPSMTATITDDCKKNQYNNMSSLLAKNIVFQTE